jgi:ADP-ribosyl-[dinitrogen reductase] hydrolase
MRSSSFQGSDNSGQIRRAVKACLLGGAIGDALGMPLEQLPEATIRASFRIPITSFNDPVPGAPCYEFRLKKGMYTDDTQAVRASARAIVESHDLSGALIADALSGWLFENSLDQSPRYPGFTTREAMKRYLNSKDANTCGVLSQACGAAIRISPAAIWLTLQGEAEFENRIREIAQVTHTDRSAVDGAVIVAHLIRTGLEGTTPPLDELLQLCTSDLMGKGLGKTQSALRLKEPAHELALELGGGTAAHEVVPMAIYHIYRNNFDFKVTLETGLNTFHPQGLDLDSILSISGAICGVRSPNGVKNSGWLDGLEDAQVISAEAEALFRTCYRS